MADFPYKLAAIDIDDTLVGRDKQIGVANRAAVRRLAELGCRVVLASGRRHDNMLPFHRALGLDGFLVSSQGAVARGAAGGEVLHQALMPATDAGLLITVGQGRGLTVMKWTGAGVFAEQRTPWVARYAEETKDSVLMTEFAEIAADPAEKVVWCAEPAYIAALAPQMRRHYGGRFIITITDPWALEFNAAGATKAAGVAAVARRHGIDVREVLAFGDGNNDAPMLAWAGLGVAMPHGRQSAREAADLIAPAGDVESSLARAVEAVVAGAGAGSLGNAA